MKVSAIANANIALVKYWGKRNKELILPNNTSISMTTDGLYAHTTVEFDKKYKEDIFILNGNKFRKGSKEYDEFIESFLKVVRKMGKTNIKAKIVSNNNFPTAAGLASSAAGFAALATAVNKVLVFDLDKKGLSMLARRGSGSATRSIFGGFVEWKKGEKEDGSDSYAEQIALPQYWLDFRMIILITSRKEKKIKSRTGMKQTVLTSPMYQSWLATVEKDIEKVKKGIIEKDFTLVGKTAEENCLKMHAVMLTTIPAIIYWNKTTIEIIHSVIKWRNEGLECYFTIDAGPQVKIICLKKDVAEIIERCKKIEDIKDIIVTKPGEDVRITQEHLF
ncbi:MAG: diphosphomevalonate decarboxylase [Candidatus Nealsonbacteria bacterium]|nr:MAG: diphosphomevalonate decarboxylase [Candidatus Nealsonbacteria bacterium]